VSRVGERLSLKLCETRWVIRSYSLFTFLSAFSVVCSSFVELEHGGDEQARSYVCPITKFDCIVCLASYIYTSGGISTISLLRLVCA
jgi:hypothetical protein